jgi:cytochrome c peroxidase
MKIPYQKAHDIIRLVILCLIGVVCINVVAGNKDPAIELSDRCPPYFRLDDQNLCRLSTLYDLYPLANPKWGGYRVALPERRDGYTPQLIDLGRYLFFDPVLSADGDLSCAHCHHPDFGMSDGRARSIGRHGRGLGPARTGGEELPRGAPMLWNMAFQQSFFWDGRAATLEEQIQTVLETSSEMATSPEQVVASLNEVAVYRRLFFEVFGDEEVSFSQVLRALVAFETSLVSLNSPYDRYIHGDQQAINAQEKNGLHIFRSFASRCSQCHAPPLFTSGQLATTGIPGQPGKPYDVGAESVLDEASLRGAFKVPALRNIARTAPFMHAGQFASLSEAVSFYNNEPGHAVADRDDLTLHWHIVNPHLRADEIMDLVAFLNTLTDEAALPQTPEVVPSGLRVPR